MNSTGELTESLPRESSTLSQPSEPTFKPLHPVVTTSGLLSVAQSSAATDAVLKNSPSTTLSSPSTSSAPGVLVSTEDNSSLTAPSQLHNHNEPTPAAATPTSNMASLPFGSTIGILSDPATGAAKKLPHVAPVNSGLFSGIENQSALAGLVRLSNSCAAVPIPQTLQPLFDPSLLQTPTLSSPMAAAAAAAAVASLVNPSTPSSVASSPSSKGSSPATVPVVPAFANIGGVQIPLIAPATQNLANRSNPDDHGRSMASHQIVSLESLSPQQNAFLLASLAGANAQLLAQQRQLGTLPSTVPGTFLLTDQGPAAVAAAAFGTASPASAPGSPLSQHGNRHSPIRHRRMRRAAENVVRTLTTPSMLRYPQGVSSSPPESGTVGLLQTAAAAAAAAAATTAAAATSSTGATPISSQGHGFDLSQVTLSLLQQPPQRTVYLKILKPFPVVKLSFGSLAPTEEDKKHLSHLFVEASLVRQLNGEDISPCLEGTRMVQVIGLTAVFRKLKILCTSQQQNSNMCIRFTLFHFTSAGCEPCPGCTVLSDPIEAYSHPVYLSPGGSVYAQQQQQAIMASHGLYSSISHSGAPVRRPRSPSGSLHLPRSKESRKGSSVMEVTSVVPDSARVGERIVLIGAGFHDGLDIRVQFGSTVVTPQINDASTLLCTVPETETEEEGSAIRIKLRLNDSAIEDSSVEFRVIKSEQQDVKTKTNDKNTEDITKKTEAKAD